MRGVRTRLTLTIVALVALSVAILGLGAYVVVDRALHDSLKEDAARQARVDLSIVIPQALPVVDRASFDATTLQTDFARRQVGLVVDFGNLSADFAAALPADLTATVARGEIGYAWTSIAGRPQLVVGGKPANAEVPFYFVHDAEPIEATLGVLRLALGVGAALLVIAAVALARSLARGVLAPVDAASRAAERIALGDFSARVPVQSADEFGAWAERFNRMAASLEETVGRLRDAEARNRRFVSDVSHELRTPLGALVAEASILREDLSSLPDSSRRAGELLVADIARLRSLVDDLMEISRFDANVETAETRPVDLGALVRSIAAARLSLAEVDVPEVDVVVESDPRRLERIVGNLLDNAREHAAGTPVAVRVARSAAGAVIAVEDRGPGVAPDRLERLFERFYKADPSRHGGSSGLGLAIAAEHAALLGGSLRASNRDGGGLRVELLLPVTGSLHGGDRAAIDGPDDERS
jgi:signal transduction histidine kinase